MVYVPIENIIINDYSTIEVENPVDKYHLKLSTNNLAFNKVNQEKTILVSNIGFEDLNFLNLILIGSNFVTTSVLPDILLSGHVYEVAITHTATTSGTRTGGMYIDVGDSYGNKYVNLIGVLP